jgi:hypothetical protein
VAAGTGDTTEHERSHVTRGETLLPDEQVLLRTEWQPPFTTVDSLVVSRRDLAPVRERLFAGGAIRVFQYLGRRVVGTVTVKDSAPRPYDTTFAEAPFAFNEVEVLVRSVPFRAGVTEVMPLFSEIDQAIEHDTVTVLGTATAPLDHAPRVWRVRFADPAIVTVYDVNQDSRRILGAVTTQRQSGTRFRYAR